MDVEPLSEIKTVRQRPTEGYRRWYVNSYFDVILWNDKLDGELIGFQLCYSRNKSERAFTWTREYQSSHHVSHGFGQLGTGHMATAILQGDGGPIPPAVIERFTLESTEMPPSARELILERLHDYNARRAHG
jgi:hypothetical protein